MPGDKVILDTFVVVDGKPVYQLHWERHMAEDRTTSYPDMDVDKGRPIPVRWGKAVDKYPGWAERGLEDGAAFGRAPQAGDHAWRPDPQKATDFKAWFNKTREKHSRAP
jgi:hypothetical protein